MSTIVRNGLRRGSAARVRDDTARRVPLSARALRVRNACLRQAAAELGMPVPDDAELNALPADATLTEALRRWKADVSGDEVAQSRRSVSLVLRTALILSVTLIGLAVSYGQVQ